MTRFPCRLLIDLPNWLGDFVHAWPVVEVLLEANRGGETTLVLPAAHVPLTAELRAHAIARPEAAGWWWARRVLDDDLDVALSLRHSTRAKLLLAGVRAAERIASHGRGAEVLGLTPFAMDRRSHQRHDFDGVLQLLGLSSVGDGPARLPISLEMRRAGQRSRHVLAGRARTAVLLPGTSNLPAKRYPPAKFGVVGEVLHAAGWRVLVAGGPGEDWLLERVAAACGGTRVPTAWRLDRMAGLLASCQVAVGNDSGLTHLAAVLGCPTVMLFGPTDPARTAAVGGARVLQEPGDNFGRLCPERVAWAAQATASGQGLHNQGRASMMTTGSGPLAQLAEQGTLNP